MSAAAARGEPAGQKKKKPNNEPTAALVQLYPRSDSYEDTGVDESASQHEVHDLRGMEAALASSSIGLAPHAFALTLKQRRLTAQDKEVLAPRMLYMAARHPQMHLQPPAPLFSLRVDEGIVSLNGKLVPPGHAEPVPRGRAELVVHKTVPSEAELAAKKDKKQSQAPRRPPRPAPAKAPKTGAKRAAENAKASSKDAWEDAEIVEVQRQPVSGNVVAVFALYTELGQPELGENYLFYKGQQRTRPDCALISDFHTTWRGDFKKLECAHGYIQWLFPLFADSGVNWDARKLEHGEARLMRRDLDVAVNIVRSYRVMLEFYGFRLVDEMTGQLDYMVDKRERRRRLENFNVSSHNNLRITRILTSLGHLGFTRYKLPFLHMLERAIKDGYLTYCMHSYNDFWKKTLDLDSAPYKAKTRESSDEREPSVFFFADPRPSTDLGPLVKKGSKGKAHSSSSSSASSSSSKSSSTTASPASPSRTKAKKKNKARKNK